MVGDFPQPARETDLKRSRSDLPSVAAIVGSLTAILLAILTVARSSLDLWLFNLLVGTLAAAIILLLVFFLVVRPLSPTIKRWRREARQESMAAGILPDLVDLVDGFFELASRDRTTGIHKAIRSFAEQKELPGLTLSPANVMERHLMQRLSSNYDTVMHTPFIQLQSDIRQSLTRQSRKQLLRHFSAEFSNLLSVYKHLFIDSYFEACKRVGVDSVPYSSREEYTKFLTKYNQFGGSYVEFAKKTNRLTGDRVLDEYFEDATPLKA